MQSVLRIVEAAYRMGRRLGPYVLLELLMPGGSLMALLLFLHRRGKLVPALAVCRNQHSPFDYRIATLVAFIRSKS